MPKTQQVSVESPVSCVVPPPGDDKMCEKSIHCTVPDLDKNTELELHHRRFNEKSESKGEKILDELSAEELKELTNSSIDCAVEAVRHGRSSIAKRNSSVKDENGLAKGIVLNANFFIHPQNSRWVSDNEINDKTKDQELVQNSTHSKIPEKSAPIVEEVNEMTLLRKIIFGFSFLPSVMFVLCFAVILPCHEPLPPEVCMKEAWSISLNNTVLSTGIGISHGLLVGLSSDNIGRIMSFNKDTGEVLWSVLLGSVPLHIDCSDYDVNGDGFSECLLMDTSGFLYSVNVSDGHFFWNFSTSSHPDSHPVILPDCDNDNVPEVAIASSTSIQIISNGLLMTTLHLVDCNTTWISLFGWTHENKTDLVFSCQALDGSDTVRLIKQTNWCSKENILQPHEKASETHELLNSFRDKVKLNEAVFLSVPNGLVAWVEDQIIFFGNDTTEKWKSQSSNHSRQRFLVYSSFSIGEHVTLISSDSSNGVRMTLLSIVDGNETSTWFSPQSEAKKAISIPGKNGDYILMLLQTSKASEMQADIKTTGLSSYPVSLQSNETYKDVQYRITFKKIEKLEHKIVLFELKNKDSTSLVPKELFSESYDIFSKTERDATELTALVEGGGDESKTLSLYVCRTVPDEVRDNYTLKRNTYLKKLVAKNWITHTSQCA